MSIVGKCPVYRRVLLVILLFSMGLVVPQILLAKGFWQTPDVPGTAVIDQVWFPQKRINPTAPIMLGVFLRSASGTKVPFTVELIPIDASGNLGTALTGLAVRPLGSMTGAAEVPADEKSEVFTVDHPALTNGTTYLLRVSQFVVTIRYVSVLQATNDVTVLSRDRAIEALFEGIRTATVVYTPVTALVVDDPNGSEPATTPSPSPFVVRGNTISLEASATRANKSGKNRRPKIGIGKPFYVTAIMDEPVNPQGNMDLSVTLALERVNDDGSSSPIVTDTSQKLRVNRLTRTFKIYASQTLKKNGSDLLAGRYRLTVLRNRVDQGEEIEPVEIEFVVK